MKVGFVGMGIMGLPMSLNLLKAGHEVTVWNRTAARCEPAAAAGARVAATLAELARGVEVVCICVSDTPDVEAVLFGDDGLAETLAEGQVVVDLSTISPTATEEFAGMLEAQGVEFLDAPVTGGQAGAIAGSLTIMVGGGAAVLERVRPVLEGMGRKIVHCGSHGSGQRTKVVNQVICGLHLLAMSEGLEYARRAGLDLGAVLDAVSAGAAGSWMLSSLGPRVLQDDWAPGFMIRLQAKDLRIALEEMMEAGSAAEGTQLTARLFTEAVEEGLGEEGTQALVKLLGWGG